MGGENALPNPTQKQEKESHIFREKKNRRGKTMLMK
jgi:hypothetical protein